MVALRVLRRHHVITQAEKTSLPLPRKSERVQRLFFSRPKELQGVALCFRFEKLPDGANLHELGRFLLYFFHLFEEFNRLRIALSQTFLEVSSKTHVPPKKHERVDVTPHFTQIRYQPHLAVQGLHRRSWKVHANARRARHCRELLH